MYVIMLSNIIHDVFLKFDPFQQSLQVELNENSQCANTKYSVQCFYLQILLAFSSIYLKLQSLLLTIFKYVKKYSNRHLVKQIFSFFFQNWFFLKGMCNKGTDIQFSGFQQCYSPSPNTDPYSPTNPLPRNKVYIKTSRTTISSLLEYY